MMPSCPNPPARIAFSLRWGRKGRPGTKGTPPMDDPANHQLHRLPGLFRRWELSQVIETGADYRIEDAGSAGDGTPLYSIYAAAPKAAGNQEAAR